MASPASIKKHPLHPMLVAIPIGLWLFALVCDVIAMAGATGPWRTVALYCIGGGIIGAVLAAVPGVIDYFSIDEAAMRRIANFHMLVNGGALVLFAINLWSWLVLRVSPSAVGWAVKWFISKAWELWPSTSWRRKLKKNLG